MSLLGRLRQTSKARTVAWNDDEVSTSALARALSALEQADVATLCTAVRAALDPQAPEDARYRAAEALARAVYPKYKFSEYGRLFLEDRDFIAFYERHTDPGNWHSLDRKYTLREMLKLVANLDGDIAECGCYKGFSAYLMCVALAGSAALVHLFDSFEGLPEPAPCDGGYWFKGALCAPQEELRETLSGFDNYRVYEGWIPECFAEVGEYRFRFVHVDVDLYQPTFDSLLFFYPRLRSGGIMLLDDYGFTTCPGAKAAADAFFSDKPEPIAMLPTGQAFIIKR